MSRRAYLTVGVLAFAAAPVTAQQRPLAARVAAVRDGMAEFRFPSRSGVCGDGHSFIRVGEHMTVGNFSEGMYGRPCVPGPVRIVVSLANGTVTRVKGYVGPEPAPSSGIVDLGTTTATEGSSYLLDIAAIADGGKASRESIFPALLGEDVVAWPRLLQIARREASDHERKHSEATFWLGRYAAAKLNGSDVPFDSDESDKSDEEDVKEHAVFALSQLRGHEGVEPLIKVARTNRDPNVRSKALFWLGESRDPRAIDVFEEILKGGR
jgi:hypothetical protein